MRPAFVIVVLWIGLSDARAAEGELAADVVAITDDAVLIDVHGKTPKGPQEGWLVLSRKPTPTVRRLWRTLPKELGPSDCDAAMAQFSKVLEQYDVGGVRLDARQCGRNDRPFWAASQVLLGGTEPKGRYVTSVTAERLKPTRAAMAYGEFPGTRWAARFTGKFLNVTRDGLSFASLPTGLSPNSPASGWVVVAPSGAMVAAFDADFGGFQLWTRTGSRWKSVLLVNALDPQ